MNLASLQICPRVSDPDSIPLSHPPQSHGILLQCTDFLVMVHRPSSCGVQALSLGHTGSRVHRLSSCGTWAWLPCKHVGSQFPEQGSDCVPCIARWILNHWTASGPFFLVHVCVCVLGFLVCGYCEVFFQYSNLYIWNYFKLLIS